MRTLFTIILLCGLSLVSQLRAQGQDFDNFFVQVNDPEPEPGKLATILREIEPSVIIEHDIFYPEIRLVAVGFRVNPELLDKIFGGLVEIYGREALIFSRSPVIGPRGVKPAESEIPPPEEIPVLEYLIPSWPEIPDIPTPDLAGNIMVELVGTGIDVQHPEFTDFCFEPALSVMADSRGGFLPGEKDHHNHETSTAACLVGNSVGLLTALQIREFAKYRPVLCYPKNNGTGPFTTVPAAVDAIDSIIQDYDLRTETPYLKNHGSVLLFPHTIESHDERVRALDQIMDLAWDKGIVVCLSGGNEADVAAATSPTGAGEWIVYLDKEKVVSTRYWPTFGSTSYTLPGTVATGTIAFDPKQEGNTYHLKAGAHDFDQPANIWFDSPGVGSNFNNANPPSLLDTKNQGIDLYAPGEKIALPFTKLTLDPSGKEVIDGTTYDIKRSYDFRSGTSYSASFVAAAATYILQQKPWATPDQVRKIILSATGSGNGGIPTLTLPSPRDIASLHLTYNQWIGRYQQLDDLTFPNAASTDFMADPDFDGVINLIEYLCGLDPRFPDNNLDLHLPSLTASPTPGTAVRLTANMQLADYLHTGKGGVQWEFQATQDFTTWTSLGQGSATTKPASANLNGDGRSTTATYLYEPPPGDWFYRIRIFYRP